MPDRNAALPNHDPRLAPRGAARNAPRRARRRAAALACSMLSIAALTACGGSSSSSSAASTTGRPVTITSWGWTRGSQQVADAFNASHQDVHVVFEQIPSGNAGGYAKISNAVKAGNEPDVFNVEYPMLPEYVSQGAVQDLTSRISGLTSQFTAQSVQLTTFAGKDWALPLDADPQVFFYRKDIFTKYGIQVPTTWDQFRTAAQELKAADPAARLATFFSDDPSTLEAMAWQAGAGWFGTSGDAWKVDRPARRRDGEGCGVLAEPDRRRPGPGAAVLKPGMVRIAAEQPDRRALDRRRRSSLQSGQRTLLCVPRKAP